MEIVIKDNNIKYIENGIEYYHLSNFDNNEKFIGEIALKAAKIETGLISDGFNILGQKFEDGIGIYMTMGEYEKEDRYALNKINLFFASSLVVYDELKARGINI